MVAEKNFEEMLSDSFNFIKTNKILHVFLTAILFLVVLVHSTDLRMNNVDILKDPTSGEYTMSDPDALYFLRMGEVLLEKGTLEGYDEMRSPGTNITYLREALPYVMVWNYKIWKIFNPEISFSYVAVVSNALIYSLGLIFFFLLVYTLTKSRIASIVASTLLAYSPPYLFRTMAGVSDHDALGMVGIFATLIVFTYAMKLSRKDYKFAVFGGVALGFITGITFAFWAGAVTFLFLILPIAFLLIYLFEENYNELNQKKKLLVTYFLWIALFLITALIVGFPSAEVKGKLMSTSSLLVPLVFVILATDLGVTYFGKKNKRLNGKYRILYSLALALIISFVGASILYGNPIELGEKIYTRLVNPFGISESGGRLGLTVSENQQPYAVDWINQTGKGMFYLFFLGSIFVGVAIGKNIKSILHKSLFILSWIIGISSILFSRYSPSSMFNGENFISMFTYVAGFLIFAGYFIWLYFNDKFKIDVEAATIFSWMIIMLVIGRAAARTIFVAMPFVYFASTYLMIKSNEYAKKSKDDVIKILLYTISIVSMVIILTSLFGNPISNTVGTITGISQLSNNFGPVANPQWQAAMAWAREETSEKDLFVHWWDYGYLVQTVGDRPSVSDGGHSAGDGGDHNVGRYLLTTPEPITALSYMKTWNVSYLIIDPTDFGKYGAYSRIGGDKDHDRYASPALLASDPKQTVETANSTRRAYQGTTFVDADIKYGNTFLPGTSFDKYQFASSKAYFIGTIVEFSNNGSNSKGAFAQPQAAFVYNNKQYLLPIRYVYYNNQMIDFKEGINSTLMLIPAVQQTANGQVQIDNFGAAIYMSERVQESLFARLYLMGDYFNQYPTIKEAHFQDDYVVQILKQQGVDLGRIIYFQGLRAPLAIWKVDYPQNVPVHEEFLEKGINEGFGGLDRLFPGYEL